jgi:hypothetical protein
MGRIGGLEASGKSWLQADLFQLRAQSTIIVDIKVPVFLPISSKSWPQLFDNRFAAKKDPGTAS